jgi:DNA-binding PadR family transcriptional regulator
MIETIVIIIIFSLTIVLGWALSNKPLDDRQIKVLTVLQNMRGMSAYEIGLAAGVQNQIHVTLHALEQQGLISSKWVENMNGPGYPRRRQYIITGLGLKAMREAAP